MYSSNLYLNYGALGLRFCYGLFSINVGFFFLKPQNLVMLKIKIKIIYFKVLNL